MDNEGKSPKGMPGFGWFLIGVAPIPIWLLIVGNDQGPISPVTIKILITLTVLCNLCGGIGCLSRVMTDVVARLALGILIAGLLFSLTVFIAVFVGCMTHPVNI
jgi:hypothetical protein